jgi:hypothetical protein
MFPFHALLCPYVPARIKARRYQIMVLSAPMLHSFHIFKTFTEFYGCQLVSESEIDYDRLALICIDNSEYQKSRALQISAACSRSIIRMILIDEDDLIDLTNQQFSQISASSWILRGSKILRQVISNENVIINPILWQYASYARLEVLLISGDNTDELVLRKIIEQIEGNCVIASTGEEGLKYLRDGMFDVAFLNRHFQLMNGDRIGEVVLRNREIYQRIPLVIQIDPAWSQMDINWSRQNGLPHILKKPFTLTNVSKVLHRAAGH